MGEGVWLVDEKEGMIVDIKRQREVAGGKGGGKKIEMSQKSLARIKPDQREKAAVVTLAVRAAEAARVGQQTSDEAKRRIARADRSAGPASDALA